MQAFKRIPRQSLGIEIHSGKCKIIFTLLYVSGLSFFLPLRSLNLSPFEGEARGIIVNDFALATTISACWLFTMWFTTETGFRSSLFSHKLCRKANERNELSLSDSTYVWKSGRNLLCSCATIHWVKYLFCVVSVRASLASRVYDMYELHSWASMIATHARTSREKKADK